MWCSPPRHCLPHSASLALMPTCGTQITSHVNLLARNCQLHTPVEVIESLPVLFFVCIRVLREAEGGVCVLFVAIP